MATISVNVGNGFLIRRWRISEEFVTAALRELIKGADDYHGGNLQVVVDGWPTAAEERRQKLRAMPEGNGSQENG